MSDFKKCYKDIMSAIRSGTRESVNRIQKEIPGDLVDRVKAGSGTQGTSGNRSKGQPEVPMKGLKRQTIERRKRARDKGELHPSTSPGTSNFTHTNHTLGNIQTTKNLNSRKVTMEIKDRKDRKKVNANIKMGRKWFALTVNEVNRATEIVGFTIAKYLSRLG